MDLTFTEAEEAFRRDVRQFLRDNVPSDMHRKIVNNQTLSRSELAAWTAVLRKKGWSVPEWPEEYGGTGWTATQHYIFNEEVQMYPVRGVPEFGRSLVGPVIYTFGNEEQKSHFLPRIASGEDWWCQGFSEPGAGSDLASLRTRAVRHNDHYIVNGQKTWTTQAQYADWIFCLVRTNIDVKKQEGISFLLIDVNTPGVSIRPIQLIDGGYEVNEVFFDNVPVPAANLVGEENKGWDYAKFLLGNERIHIASIGALKERIRRTKELAIRTRVDGGRLIDQVDFREKVAAVEIQLKALEMTQLRVLSNQSKNKKEVQDPASAILKIKASEIRQAIAEISLDLVGPYALPALFEDAFASSSEDAPVLPDWAATIAPIYFNVRKVSIYGGSNEIQKNIIAKAILGL